MSIFKVVPRFISVFLPYGLVLVLLILSGCAGFGRRAPEADTSETVMATEVAAGPGEAGAEEVVVGLPEVPAEEPAVAEKVVSGETFKEEAAPAEAASEDTDGWTVESETAKAAPVATASPAPTSSLAEVEAEMAVEADLDESRDRVEVQQAEPLRAGEVDDNTQWDDYLLYRRNYRGPQVHDRDVSERYLIEVTDEQDRPVLGANVRFFLPGQQRQEIYSVHTYANGQVLFHPTALDIPLEQVDRFQVEVQKGNLLQQFTLTRFEAQTSTSFTERWTVSLDLGQPQFDSLNLDVLFLIDATGSMADEIAKIQSTIFDVSARIDALPEKPNVRYGMVTYRDRGDSFVSKVYDFTPDVRDFSKNLSTVWADGGGDYPESLNEGLHKAVNQVEWRSEDTVKLIFLVADAPPHLDYAQDYDYAVEMENAARRGIKIFPVASSGLDDQGEYIFRQLAQYTMGRFIFLTYEGPTNSGAPGDTTTHHVEDYSVENLDDLLVKLVEGELAYQNPQFARVQ